ncbi:MAG TPA: hypothetical protein VGC79_35895 [Polyangiaceae bacterium]
MTYRSWLLAACVSPLLLACGGEATQGGSGSTGGSSNVAGSHSGGAHSSNGGSSNGGSSNGGSPNGGSPNGGSGGDRVCCDAVPVCPPDERQAQGSECPGQASCRQLSLCCSSIWCVTSSDAAGAGGAIEAASHDCNGALCSATEVCIGYRTLGGALSLPDGGTCPTGKHIEDNQCRADFAYKCADLRGACRNHEVSCACAEPPNNNPGVCPTGYGSCSAPEPTADSPAQLLCQQLVP